MLFLVLVAMFCITVYFFISIAAVLFLSCISCSAALYSGHSKFMQIHNNIETEIIKQLSISYNMSSV